MIATAFIHSKDAGKQGTRQRKEGGERKVGLKVGSQEKSGRRKVGRKKGRIEAGENMEAGKEGRKKRS